MNLADLSIKRPIFIASIVILMLVIGWTCFKGLPVEKFPDISFPIVSVTTTYKGAGPAEIETLVTKPLEDELSTISGIKRLTSKSLEGTSQITIEFQLNTDIKYGEQRVRDKVSTAKPKLPKEIDEPSIQKIDPSDTAILEVSVSGNLSDGKLYDLADQFLKPRIEEVNDVGSVEIVGGRKREIHVNLDRAKIKDRDLSITGIASRLEASGENVPGGKVDQGSKAFRSMGEFAKVQDISQTLVNLYGNEVPTRVSDIGTVTDTLQDETSRVFINGKKSLFIEIYRQSGSNTLQVVNDVLKQLNKLKPELATMEGSPKVELVLDGGKEIQDNVDDVEQTIILGIILTILVVYLFLANGRSTFITGLALPNSLIGSFILMKVAGFSLNVVSLLALTLAVGLLIDDAIVVRENIFRKIEDGMDAEEAARKGTLEVQLAVIATTLVVISVFSPVAMMSGIVGKFLIQFGLTVCFAMVISLFDALTIAPMLSAYLAGAVHKREEADSKKTLWSSTVGRLLKSFDRFQTRLENSYEKFLRLILRNPIKTILASLAVFILCMSTVTHIPFTFIPEADNGQFTVEMELPPGASLDSMNEVSFKADEILRKNPEVELSALTVGGKNGEAYKSSFFVQLVPGKKRSITTSKMKLRVREQLKSLAYANPIVKDFDATGGGQTQPITLNLVSINQKDLMDYAPKLIALLKSDPRFVDVDSNYRPGKPEIQITADPQKAQAYGINTRTMGDEIKAQVEGLKPAKFRENGTEYDIRVRLLPEQRDLSQNYRDIWVPNMNGRLIRLTDVANIKNEVGPATIDRQDRSRYVQITAANRPDVGIGELISTIDKIMATDLPLPVGMRSIYVGQSENFQDLGRSMVIAVGFGVLFVFFVLASLYESFITPITIMIALPLALCGAFLGMFLLHEQLSLFAFLGIVMLLSVACKNSILLVDYTRHLIEAGRPRTEAIVEACRIRLRPILMTSMALIAGTIPVAIGLNESAKQRTGMGVAIIGGLISSTLLTLIVVPVAFTYVDRLRIWLGRKIAKLVGYRGKLSVVPDSPENSGASKVV
jgi:HAE1 family hydrophobic/amphiphilic exporter-1